MLEDYGKINRFRVPFGDVDMLRHVNNTAYLRWAETARCEYFVEVLGAEITGTMGMIMATLQIEYERPIAYRENVAVGCRISRLGTKSFDFDYEIWSEDHDARCAEITSTMVAMDYGSGSTIAVPADWRAKIAAFERAPVTA
jgi:acyl-CoA thioester hydrolase